MTGPETVTIEDCRRAGHCVRGVKAWCEQHQVDFRDFLKNGMSVEKALSFHDGFSDQIVARKRAREAS